MRLTKVNPTKNMKRFYELDVQPNLFGGHSLMRSWGRIGTRGQIKVELHEEEGMATQSFEQLCRSKINRGYEYA